MFLDDKIGDLYVTGMSWSTPLGDDLDGVWKRLLAGQDGFGNFGSTFPLRNDLVAGVRSVSTELRHDSRMLSMATACLRTAFADAGLNVAENGVALVLGTSYGAHLDEPVTSLYDWAVRCAESIGFLGDPVCVSTACSAASDALMVGASLVQSGKAKAAVCGGVDILTPAKRLAHSKLGTLSRDRLRAFDVAHSGMVLGEGSGFLVLELDAERANRRYATFRGSGSSNDAASVTAPAMDGSAVRLAIERALRGSGLSISDIAAVSAHGTGTVLNDQAEGRGLALAFGGLRELPVVFGTKGALGHSLGACGAIEAISLILALRHQVAPPIVGLRSPIGEAASFVRRGCRKVSGNAGISLTLGFGGFNTALAFSVEREVSRAGQ
jgi:3-oxoacyl-[acyl-carrier-protein] synthase II